MRFPACLLRDHFLSFVCMYAVEWDDDDDDTYSMFALRSCTPSTPHKQNHLSLSEREREAMTNSSASHSIHDFYSINNKNSLYPFYLISIPFI
jgi:hypothetical protein